MCTVYGIKMRAITYVRSHLDTELLCIAIQIDRKFLQRNAPPEVTAIAKGTSGEVSHPVLHPDIAKEIKDKHHHPFNTENHFAEQRCHNCDSPISHGDHYCMKCGSEVSAA